MRGLLTILLLMLNTLFWGTPIVLLGIVKFAVQITAPRSRTRTRVMLALASLGDGWVRTNGRIFDRVLPTRWDIQGIDEGLDPNGRYLVISNHQSWVDIFALQRAFYGRAAFLRFFLKHQLIWFPIVGQACWAMEFPFMHRYSPEYLERHPEKRGKDLETTRRAAQRYRHIPVSILNFVEGTRFTRDKQADQESPYRHLLRPRIGGIAFILASLGDQLDAVFDMTIAYPNREVSMWAFANGTIPEIVVRARRVTVPPEFMTAAVTEPGPERERLKQWIGEIWKEKDNALDTMVHSYHG
ncbi:MAG: acyltransferase [Thermoanaerobaculia bacterium]